MRNQINLVRKGLEPGNVCLTDSLLSKQTRMPVCVWSLVPGLWAAGASVAPAKLSAEPGAVGLHTRAGLPGGAVAWTPQEPASSFLEPPGHMLAAVLSVSGAGGGGGLSPSVSPGIFERPF